MIKIILANGGHEVIGEASNGREAVEKYRQLKPDLVTMDITMPVMDGVTAALSDQTGGFGGKDRDVLSDGAV